MFCHTYMLFQYRTLHEDESKLIYSSFRMSEDLLNYIIHVCNTPSLSPCLKCRNNTHDNTSHDGRPRRKAPRRDDSIERTAIQWRRCRSRPGGTAEDRCSDGRGGRIWHAVDSGCDLEHGSSPVLIEL